MCFKVIYLSCLGGVVEQWLNSDIWRRDSLAVRQLNLVLSAWGDCEWRNSRPYAARDRSGGCSVGRTGSFSPSLLITDDRVCE